MSAGSSSPVPVLGPSCGSSLSAVGHLQPSCSIDFDGSLPSDTFRAPGCSVTEAMGQIRTIASSFSAAGRPTRETKSADLGGS